MVCENIFTAPPRPNGHKIDYVTIFFGDSNSWRASKLHYWFQSYSVFSEWEDFVYWWSFSREGTVSAACAAGLFDSEDLTSDLIFVKSFVTLDLCFYDHNRSKSLQNLFLALLDNPINKNQTSSQKNLRWSKIGGGQGLVWPWSKIQCFFKGFKALEKKLFW